MQPNQSWLLLLTNFLIFTQIYAQQCSFAPTRSFQMRCNQLRFWDLDSRTTPPLVQPDAVQPPFIGSPPVPAPNLSTIPSTPYDCMDLGCLCSYFGGSGRDGTSDCTLANGQPLQRAVRQEYRMLSDTERNRYHAALNTLKRSGVYDEIAALHANATVSGGAHGAPSFLPWHRVYLKRYEIALRQIDPSVALPYFDSTLESHLPNPADSAVFTSAFMGSTDSQGNVVDGPCAGWQTNGEPLQRKVGEQARPFTDDDIEFAMSQTTIEMMLAFTTKQESCTAPTSFNVLEYTHGEVHLWIGGNMGPLRTSANDPFFFMHHAFVDFIWEMWRNARQSRDQREREYPQDDANCESPKGFATAAMSPFEPKRNIDGCSNQFTDNFYQYGQRPSCSLGTNCGSNYLYCVRSRGVCVPKIRLGGNCQGFSVDDDICLVGQCTDGVCQQTDRIDYEPYDQEETHYYLPIPRTKQGQSVLRPIHVSCFNEHQCCSYWASIGECRRNPGYMSSWCRPSCHLCEPNYDNVTDCADHHHKCKAWAARGECTRNRLWMEENCRLTCTNCYAHRSIVCGGGFREIPQKYSAQQQSTLMSQFTRADDTDKRINYDL